MKISVFQQQCYLTGLGYYTLKKKDGTPAIDGIRGPATRSAIMAFQKAYNMNHKDSNIAEDGLYGPQTEQALFKAITENMLKPVPSAPDNPEDIPGAVYKFLREKGFSREASAGIMGNISAESNMKPTNLEDQYERAKGFTDLSYTVAVDDGSYPNFATDRCGYGICQWTAPSSRKSGLLNLAKERGLSVGSLSVQLDWLWHELSTQYTSLVKRLKAPGISVYDATRLFMLMFENPLHQEPEYIQRRANISMMYYNRYS